MEAHACRRCIASARYLLACLPILAAVPSTAQIQFFVPNATIEAPAAGFIRVFAQDERTLFIDDFSSATQVYTRRGQLRWELEGTLVPPPAPYGFLAMEDVDGDLAVGRASYEGPPNQPPNGAVVVYQRVNGIWQLTHVLTAPEEHAVGFGLTIDVDGDTIAISSYTGGGAVFIYRRTASGDVILQQEIDTDAGEQRLALDSGTLLVSAVQIQVPSALYGVQVYKLTDEGAVPVQTLVPSDPVRGETFGDSLSISGDVAVIGAPFGGERTARCGFMSDRFGPGHAFIFERDDDGVWQEIALLDNPDCGWFFGGNTATDGKRILSRASYIGDPTGNNADSRAYLYERREGIWSLQGALMAPMCSNDFGIGRSLVKRTLLTGANGEIHGFRMNHLIAVPPRICNPPSSP
jgi:hypothetical protein